MIRFYVRLAIQIAMDKLEVYREKVERHLSPTLAKIHPLSPVMQNYSPFFTVINLYNIYPIPNLANPL